MLTNVLSGIGEIKLKRTGTKSDRSQPMIRAGLDVADMDRYLKNVQDTYVEEWEPLLFKNKLTFATTYLQMTLDEATAFISSFERYEVCFKKAAAGGESFDFEEFFASEITSKKVFQDLLVKLQGQMNISMAEWKSKKVFVKGSSRSAKDSVIYMDSFHCDLSQRCAKIRDSSVDQNLSMNSVVIAMLGAGKDAMASESAEYFLRLFVRSERIYQDLTLAVERPPFQSGFAIRQHCEIEIGLEFRGFVFNNRLNALCQYDYVVKIDKLQDEIYRSRIVRNIQYFFQHSIVPALQGTKFTDYVVDFAIDDAERVWIIELNPFEPSTDGAMFSWHRESDILRGEGDLFQFRFQDRDQNAVVALSMEWRDLFKEITSPKEVSALAGAESERGLGHIRCGDGLERE